MTDALAARWDTLAADPEQHVCSLPATTDPTVAMIVDHMPPAGVLLDVGCGQGRLAVPVADALPDVHVRAVDISPEMLARAPAHPRVRYQIGDGHHVPRPAAGAWSVFLFQHLPPAVAASYLASLAGQLNPGGPILVQFIAGDHHLDLDHRYPPDQLTALAEQAGLQAVTATPGDATAHPIGYPDWWWLTARSPL